MTSGGMRLGRIFYSRMTCLSPYHPEKPQSFPKHSGLLEGLGTFEVELITSYSS